MREYTRECLCVRAFMSVCVRVCVYVSVCVFTVVSCVDA